MDWIGKFDLQRKNARLGIRLVEEAYPSLADRCAEVLVEVERSFDRVLEDPSSIGTEAGYMRGLLEELRAEAKALDQASDLDSSRTRLRHSSQ